MWLMSAAWRCHIIGDPFVKLGKLLQGSAEDEQDEAEDEGEEEEEEDASNIS